MRQIRTEHRVMLGRNSLRFLREPQVVLIVFAYYNNTLRISDVSTCGYEKALLRRSTRRQAARQPHGILSRSDEAVFSSRIVLPFDLVVPSGVNSSVRANGVCFAPWFERVLKCRMRRMTTDYDEDRRRRIDQQPLIRASAPPEAT